MKKPALLLLALGLLVPALSDVCLAQIQYEYCIVKLTGQNQARSVDGLIDTECGGPLELGHSAPFGNWGVSSNYGDIRDTDQFRGWSPQDGPSTKRQWNSCTTGYPPPDCRHYQIPSCGPPQTSSAIVSHGAMNYRASTTYCPPPNDQGQSEEDPRGCEIISGWDVGQGSNYMTLYELDPWVWNFSGDGHDLVETLYFPGTSVTLTSCDYESCPERVSGWVQMTSSTSWSADVEAELRMKASARLEGFCDWNW